MQPQEAPSNRHERRQAVKAPRLGATLQLQNYTVKQYCDAYNESKSSLYRQWANGEGPPRFKRGNRTLIPVDGADDYQRSLLERGA